jgi:type VI secretion system secreted protein VgrG
MTVMGQRFPCSSSNIDVERAALKGLLITIEGNALAQMKAPMTRINADGLLQLKGGLTMIG